jgi:hypothetical protein
MYSRCLLVLLISIPAFLNSAEPEPQVSFAREVRPHGYYVEQAEAWSKELQKDSLSETNWYNYFRACRNAQGTADWRSDFVDESPYLMEGGEVVELMGEYIPDTFTHLYLSYMTQGIGTANHENLFKAYAMNPDFPGIHSSMVSYAESSMDRALRKEVNREWIKQNYISPQLLNYCYNVLMSVDKDAILFTQHDNDTYPMWILQDALGIREDVSVINIDFLLLPEFREGTFGMLGVAPADLGEVDIDEYHENWESSVSHVLEEYSGGRPIYLGMTLFEHLYEDFEKELYVSGLTLLYSKEPRDTSKKNIDLYENTFLLDYLSHNFYSDPNQMNVNYQNTNYVSCFKEVFDIYRAEGRADEADTVRRIALDIAGRIDNPGFVERVGAEFE